MKTILNERLLSNSFTFDRPTTPHDSRGFDDPSSTEDTRLQLRRILVPVDFTSASLSALRYATRLARQFGSQIYLLHVLERGMFLNDLDSRLITKPADEVASDSVEQLSQLARRELPADLPVKPLGRSGKPGPEIVHAAETLDIDLILLAAHNHSALRRALLGSTADYVARHAACPVFLARPGDDDDELDPVLWRDTESDHEPSPTNSPFERPGNQ
ncbi:MAG: universal stress protein [Verrucomicrobiales bacterium]|nr:universal stress protein [Verrucomicrobiales bacterium]